MITAKLNRQLHAELTRCNLMSQKKSLVISYTNKRTEHSSEMMNNEVIELLNYLRSQRSVNPREDALEKMRRKIISMAHEMGWHTLDNGQWVIDMTHLNAWMEKSSYLHKKLNVYSYKELPGLVTQFEKVYKSFLKKV